MINIKDLFNKLNSLSQTLLTLDSLDESLVERQNVEPNQQLIDFVVCLSTVAHFFSFIISYSESHNKSANRANRANRVTDSANPTDPTNPKDPEKSDNRSIGSSLITFMTALDIRLFYDMFSQTTDDTRLWF